MKTRTISNILPVIALLLLAIPMFIWLSKAFADEAGGLPMGSSNIMQNAPPNGAGQGSAPAPPMKDILDIKPLIIPEPGLMDRLYLLYIIGAALLIIALYFLYRHIRRRGKNITEMKPVILVAPEKPARESLNRLEESFMKAELTPKEFYFRLSFIARAYLKARFKIDAPEMTTEELVPRMKKLSSKPMTKVKENMEAPGGLYENKDMIDELRRFFLNIDPIKYAGGLSLPEEMGGDLKRVRAFVEDTTRLADAFTETETKEGESRTP